MKFLKTILLPAIMSTAVITSAPAAAAGGDDVKITAKIDSVQTLQGLLRRIDVEVIQPEGVSLEWNAVTPGNDGKTIVELYPGIEISKRAAIDSTRLGNGRLQLRSHMLVQPWDSGEFVIPGIPLYSGLDTFRSNQIALKVIPADTDTMTSINKALMPTIEQDRHFWDWVPDWLYFYWWVYLIALLAIGGAITAYIIYVRNRTKAAAEPLEPAIPPYDKAMIRLEDLKQSKLYENGDSKLYFTTLTDILREYLEGRFGIYAMEMTTPQIKRAVYATVSEKTASKMMNEILEMADFVKFAKMRPLTEENLRAFNQAMQFVENTKPEPEPTGKEATR